MRVFKYAMRRKIRTGALIQPEAIVCLRRMGYFFKLFNNPETAENSQHIPMMISAIFQPILSSKQR